MTKGTKWLHCAEENSYCKPPHLPSIICYGANDQFNCKKYNSSEKIKCNDKNFNVNSKDPNMKYVKSCWTKSLDETILPENKKHNYCDKNNLSQFFFINKKHNYCDKNNLSQFFFINKIN